MKRFVTLLFLLAAFSIATAQVVVTVPEFPTENDSIVVIFDATEGDGGLQGFNGDVYAHTGVITNQSTGSSDWRGCAEELLLHSSTAPPGTMAPDGRTSQSGITKSRLPSRDLWHPTNAIAYQTRDVSASFPFLLQHHGLPARRAVTTGS